MTLDEMNALGQTLMQFDALDGLKSTIEYALIWLTIAHFKPFCLE